MITICYVLKKEIIKKFIKWMPLALIRLDYMPDLQAEDPAASLALRRGRKGRRILEGDTCGKEKGLLARDQLV